MLPPTAAANRRGKGDPMRQSRDRILTSHAGSLPRPDDLIELNQAREAGTVTDEGEFSARLGSAVAEVVRRQQEAGIDVPGDGEYGKAMGQRVNYRAWWSYSFQRLGGLELGTQGLYDVPPSQSRPGHVVLTSFADRRDRRRFAAAYADPDSGITTGPRPPRWPVCVGPLTYTGHEAIRADVRRLKAALAAAGIEEGFMTSIAPGSASRIVNRHYRTDEEFLFACAEALREEYRTIVDGGLILQLDDPAIAENWDMVNPEPTVADYRRFSMVRVEALNHAIRGLPEDRIRFHLCWGSWHGPHTTDIPMRDIVDVMLAVRCRAYSFEAANVRHEHEWRVWENVALPEDKILLPGVVSHATNVVEHPDLVAERIARFAGAVGRERVIASTDCGLGGRVHPQIAWAKLESLAQGAALATRGLWGAGARRAAGAPPSRGKPRTGGSSTMAKSKKASARVTSATREQAAAADAAKSVVRGTAMKAGAAKQTAGKQFDKTRSRAIQAHVQARGQRRQAKRDSR